jgi:spore maturation protein CgeB
MRFVIFTHSLLSDWNHGNAHFLRGIATELVERGHCVDIYEPRGGWSLTRLLAEHGEQPLQELARVYPLIHSQFYDEQTFDPAALIRGAHVAIVHEWNSHEVVRKIGEYRAAHPDFHLFFHDTHHRSVTDPEAMSAYDLRHYDGVLAYGGVIRDLYENRGWAKAAWTWHEAADTRIFRPLKQFDRMGDLVWIGNWGDGERSREIREFLIEPVKALGLRAMVYGVRYPREALEELEAAGIQYGGWLPNYRVPRVFAHYGVTVHIPRGPYAKRLPGIPTIRPFEALACGIPLISAPWQDSESLFRPGVDFLFARDGREMISDLRRLLKDRALADCFAANGLETIRNRHTCCHRVDELFAMPGMPQTGAIAQEVYQA